MAARIPPISKGVGVRQPHRHSVRHNNTRPNSTRRKPRAERECIIKNRVSDIVNGLFSRGRRSRAIVTTARKNGRQRIPTFDEDKFFGVAGSESAVLVETAANKCQNDQADHEKGDSGTRGNKVSSPVASTATANDKDLGSRTRKKSSQALPQKRDSNSCLHGGAEEMRCIGVERSNERSGPEVVTGHDGERRDNSGREMAGPEVTVGRDARAHNSTFGVHYVAWEPDSGPYEESRLHRPKSRWFCSDGRWVFTADAIDSQTYPESTKALQQSLTSVQQRKFPEHAVEKRGLDLTGFVQISKSAAQNSPDATRQYLGTHEQRSLRGQDFLGPEHRRLSPMYPRAANVTGVSQMIYRKGNSASNFLKESNDVLQGVKVADLFKKPADVEGTKSAASVVQEREQKALIRPLSRKASCVHRRTESSLRSKCSRQSTPPLNNDCGCDNRWSDGKTRSVNTRTEAIQKMEPGLSRKRLLPSFRTSLSNDMIFTPERRGRTCRARTTWREHIQERDERVDKIISGPHRENAFSPKVRFFSHPRPLRFRTSQEHHRTKLPLEEHVRKDDGCSFSCNETGKRHMSSAQHPSMFQKFQASTELAATPLTASQREMAALVPPQASQWFPLR